MIEAISVDTPQAAYESKPETVVANAVLYDNIKKIFAIAMNKDNPMNYENLNKEDKYSMYPIDWAILTGNVNATKILIKHSDCFNRDRLSKCSLTDILKAWLLKEQLKSREMRSKDLINEISECLEEPQKIFNLYNSYVKNFIYCCKISNVKIKSYHV